MSLRLACDLDGTLVDMETALHREAERLFGPGIALRPHVTALAASVALGDDSGRMTTAPESSAPSATTVLTDSQMRALWAHVRRIPDFWVGLDEIEPGAVARLAALSTAHRFEVIFVTQRPSTAGDTVQRQSQRWLAAHGFACPSVFVVTRSRGKLADALALDAVLDDRAENCVDVKADSKARPLLVWRGRPEDVPRIVAHLGIDVTFAMSEALERLEAMTRPRPRAFLRRLGTMWPYARPTRRGAMPARGSSELSVEDQSR